jgi:hypothetical protein
VLGQRSAAIASRKPTTGLASASRLAPKLRKAATQNLGARELGGEGGAVEQRAVSGRQIDLNRL